MGVFFLVSLLLFLAWGLALLYWGEDSCIERKRKRKRGFRCRLLYTWAKYINFITNGRDCLLMSVVVAILVCLFFGDDDEYNY